jgi:hypothetical protein
MANLSDAFGTITVEKVGKEFLEYLRKVQGSDKDAYYKLLEVDDLKQAEVDENNNLSLNFNTFGRWNYSNNVEGYLLGKWMQANEYVPESHQKAYEKFVKAMVRKDGKVTIEYTDSDTAMDWMGTGEIVIEAHEGELALSEAWDEQSPITMEKYCKLYEADEYEALESLYGDEVAAEYDKYVESKKGEKPLEPAEWFDKVYEYEEV